LLTITASEDMSGLWSDSNNAMAVSHQPRPPELPPVGSFSRGRPASSQVASRGSFDRTVSGKQSGRPVTANTVGAQGDYFLPNVPQNRPMTSSTALSQDLGGRTPDTSLIFGEPHGVPHMRGVHTSQSALERDAANHWKKWGCGGKGPADMLVHLAEELKHCCWEEEERCFPDKRMERIHEQMIHISQRLIRQPPKGPDPPQLPSIEKKEPPPSTLMTENQRLRHELRDAKDMADALETTVTNYVTFKSKTKAREKWMRAYALGGRFLAYDVAAAKTACAAWSKGIAANRSLRKSRECSGELIKYHQDLGLLATCLSLWEANHRVVVTRELVAETLRTWMHRHKSDVLVYPVFAGWSHQTTLVALDREKEKAQKAAVAAEEKMKMEKKRLMDKFGEVAMAQLKKVINADEETCLKIALTYWMELIRMRDQEALDEKARLEAEARAEKERQRRLEITERCFHRHSRTLRANAFRGWCGVVEYALNCQKQLEKNMNMTMKGIMSSELKLKQAVIFGWLEACKDDIKARQRHEIATVRALLAKARSRAFSMLGRRDEAELKATQALALNEWFRIMDSAKQLKKRKDGNIARAMKGLIKGNAEIQRKCFHPWMEHYKKRKAKDLRLEQVSKTIGMNKNELLRDAMSLWYQATVADLRQRQDELRKREEEKWREFIRQQQLKSCEKCFGRKAADLVKTCWKGWLAVLDDTNLKRAMLEKGMNQALKMIMGQDVTVKRTIISLWVEAVRQDEVQRRLREQELARSIIARARENILKSMNNKIFKMAEAMKSKIFDFMKTDARETKLERIRKEAAWKNGIRLAGRINNEISMWVVATWHEMVEKKKAREKKLQAIERSLGMSNKGRGMKFIMCWARFTQECKKERLEAAAKAAVEAEAARKIHLEQRRLIIADRWFFRIKKRQTEELWNFWISEVEAMKLAGKKYEENMSKATRIIFSSEAALKGEVFSIWKEDCAAELKVRLEMKLRDAEKGMQMVKAARERAVQMFKKNVYANQLALLQAVVLGWTEQLEIARVRALRDSIVMSNVETYIRKNETAIVSMAVGSWQKLTEDTKGYSGLRRDAETAVRQHFLQLCQGVIMRMHKRVAVAHVWDAWAERALGR